MNAKLTVAMLIILALAIAVPAHAGSCTQQGAECAAWAVGQYASYKGACAKEVGSCKVRCKQGQKYFLGVLVGNQYPIDACN